MVAEALDEVHRIDYEVRVQAHLALHCSAQRAAGGLQMTIRRTANGCAQHEHVHEDRKGAA